MSLRTYEDYYDRIMDELGFDEYNSFNDVIGKIKSLNESPDYKSLYEQASQEREEICNELGFTGIPPTKEMLRDKIKILNIDNKKLNKFKDEAEENSLSFPVVESLMNDIAEAKSTQRTFETLYIKFRNYIGKIHEEIWKVAGEKLTYNYRGWTNLNSIRWFDGDDIDEYMKNIDWREEKSLSTLKEIMYDVNREIDNRKIYQSAIDFIERYYFPQEEIDYVSEEESVFINVFLRERAEDDFRFPLYENDDYDDDYDEDSVIDVEECGDGISQYVYKEDYYNLCNIKKYWDMYVIVRTEGRWINAWIDCMNEY
tara:strand:- start:424 stop:1362 length:939 start_codon:yes stop_codon:yes gene_type:complete